VIADVVFHMAPGSTWIDMSTASPDVANVIAAVAQPRAVRSLDAPVGGDPAAAEDGRLLAFVGGSAADLEAQRAVIDVLADRIVHVGAAGALVADLHRRALAHYGERDGELLGARFVAERAGVELRR
jgi:3-hydroxyisobutyrate dehydrogenase-like beta-hydroxyacid dehydrogenase